MERFCIAEPDRPRFVARLESVLDIYQGKYDAQHVLIAMDEASKQILSDVNQPLPMRPGKPKRVDDKYERHGTCALFMFYNPIDGWRRVGCRDSRTRRDWAEEVQQLLDVDYPKAKKVTLVCDNLNTHDIASLYFTFDAETAHRLSKRLQLVFTPKNGSWLNVAEMELSILSRQSTGNRRFATKQELSNELQAWQKRRNNLKCGTNWRFNTKQARQKLKSLYPVPDIYQ